MSRKCCLCNYISKWLDFQVFSDKDYKPEVPSHNPCALTPWDVKEPTHSSQRVGHGVPGVLIFPACGRRGRISLKGLCLNETTIAYNSQKSGYLAKCWNLTMTMTIQIKSETLLEMLSPDSTPGVYSQYLSA